MITLGTTFATAGYFMRSSPADKAKGPPIAASSKEEESFVKYVNRRKHDLFQNKKIPKKKSSRGQHLGC
jgi:hypothetical protein